MRLKQILIHRLIANSNLDLIHYAIDDVMYGDYDLFAILPPYYGYSFCLVYNIFIS